MSLADDALTRAGWTARAAFLVKACDDLRQEITIAIRQKPPHSVMTRLAECDVHLGVAQVEIREAISRMEQIA